MEKGFIFLAVFLLIVCTAVSLAVMSDNVSNAVKLTPNESQPDIDNNCLININTATQEELMLLPGIGVELANRIIEYREKHGNYGALDDLQNIKGISFDTLSKLSALITVGG